MSKTVLTHDELEWALAIVALLDPADYGVGECRAVIEKIKASEGSLRVQRGRRR